MPIGVLPFQISFFLERNLQLLALRVELVEKLELLSLLIALLVLYFLVAPMVLHLLQ